MNGKLTIEEKIKILEDNTKFFHWIVRRYCTYIKNNEDLEDLESLAKQAFWEALSTYDILKGKPLNYCGNASIWAVCREAPRLHRWNNFSGGDYVETVWYVEPRIAERIEYYRWLVAQIKQAVSTDIKAPVTRADALAWLNNVDHPFKHRQWKSVVINEIRKVCKNRGICYVSDRSW